MNNKMTIVAVGGIMTLSLLAVKPLTNQVFAKCSSDLSIEPHIHQTTLTPNGLYQTTPVTISGTLSCGGVGIDGATVTVSGLLPRYLDCGTLMEYQTLRLHPLTNASGGFETSDTEINLGPSCTTPYSISVHYDGDDTHGPADASTKFSIDETPTAGTEHGSIQSSNNTE